jgi:hypothetical protein
VENTCNLDPSKQVNVPRGFSGKSDLGHHPGMFIQMDHTIVDLRLVDDWTEEDYERAWITLGKNETMRNFRQVSIIRGPVVSSSMRFL